MVLTYAVYSATGVVQVHVMIEPPRQQQQMLVGWKAVRQVLSPALIATLQNVSNCVVLCLGDPETVLGFYGGDGRHTRIGTPCSAEAMSQRPYHLSRHWWGRPLP